MKCCFNNEPLSSTLVNIAVSTLNQINIGPIPHACPLFPNIARTKIGLNHVMNSF